MRGMTQLHEGFKKTSQFDLNKAETFATTYVPNSQILRGSDERWRG